MFHTDQRLKREERARKAEADNQQRYLEIQELQELQELQGTLERDSQFTPDVHSDAIYDQCTNQQGMPVSLQMARLNLLRAVLVWASMDNIKSAYLINKMRTNGYDVDQESLVALLQRLPTEDRDFYGKYIELALAKADELKRAADMQQHQNNGSDAGSKSWLSYLRFSP